MLIRIPVCVALAATPSGCGSSADPTSPTSPIGSLFRSACHFTRIDFAQRLYERFRTPRVWPRLGTGHQGNAIVLRHQTKNATNGVNTIVDIAVLDERV